MIIIISGLSGSGKSISCKYLAEKFEYKLISASAYCRNLMKENNLDIIEFTRFLEKNKNIDMEIDNYIKNEILKYKKDLVVESRTMPFLIDEIKDQLEDKIFKIFLFCDEDVRIKRISERNNVSLEEAKKIVKSRDYSDIKRYLELYGKDFTNPKYYDLILNNTKMTPEEQNKILEKIIKLFN